MNRVDVTALAARNAANWALRTCARRIHVPICTPLNVAALITYKCPLRCKQCDLWKHRRDELSLEQWVSTVASLRKWLGRFHLEISGGEPLARRDCLDLVEAAARMGVLVGITTNAVMIDTAMAERLAGAGLFNINVSLDGTSPDTVDGLRGVPGTYDRVIRAISALQAGSLSVGHFPRIIIKSTIMGPNIDEIPQLVHWVEQEGLFGIRFQFLEQNFGGAESHDWYKTSDLWISDPERVDTIIDELIQMKRRGAPILNETRYLEAGKLYYRNPGFKRARTGACGIGFTNFTINSNGDVALCDSMRPVGNVTDATPRQIWVSRGAQKRRQQISKCTRTCVLLCHVERSLMENVELFVGLMKNGSKHNSTTDLSGAGSRT